MVGGEGEEGEDRKISKKEREGEEMRRGDE
jgi:hypothetical protein